MKGDAASRGSDRATVHASSPGSMAADRLQPTAAAERAAAPATGLAGVAARVRDARGWRRLALAALAGGLSVLALAPVFFWPVLFVTLPVLVWLLDAHHPGSATGVASPSKSSILAAARDGWAFAFGYFFFGLFWIGEAFLVEAEIFGALLPFAITLMPAGLALFWGLAAAAAHTVWTPGIARVLALAVAVSCAEWLRGHILTGFPWNVLGYALTAPIELMQAAALIGIYGLTLVAVVVFAAPLVVLAADARRDRDPHGQTVVEADARASRPAWRAALVAITLAALPLAGLYAYGAVRLATPPAPPVPGVKLRVVQPATPQREKWQPDKQAEIFKAHLDLSRTDANGRIDDLAGVTHVVWPEAAMPFLPLSSPQALTAIGDLLPPGRILLSGALRVTDADVAATEEIYTTAPGIRRAYNSLMAFGDAGQLLTLYDKIHLVPFGEYLPFQETLEAIGLQSLTRVRGGFSIGPAPRPLLEVSGLPAIAPLICYEAIFPGAVVQGEARPGLLLNVTNDGWFGDLTGPFQHFHQSRVRAVEEGVPLVRASNNGVSAMVDPYGRVVHRLGLNRKGSFDTALPAALPPPLYGRYGDMTFAALLLLSAVLLVFRRRNLPS